MNEPVLTQGQAQEPQATTPADAGQIADWRSSLAPEFKDSPALKDYKDINGLVKSHINLQSKLGANPLVLPKEDAKPEEWDAVYNKLGRPEAFDKYKLPETNVPKEYLNDEMKNHFLKVFHASGLSQKQAEKVYGEYMNYIGGQVNSMKEAQVKETEVGLEALKKDWGTNFDTNVSKALKVMGVLEGDLGKEFKGWLDSNNLHSNPMLIKVLSHLGDKLLEDVADGTGYNTMGDTPEKVAQEFNTLVRDESFMKALNDRSSPGHKAAVEKWREIHARGFGRDKVEAL